MEQKSWELDYCSAFWSPSLPLVDPQSQMNQIIHTLFWRPVILKQKYLITSSTKLLIPQHPVNSSLITELVISLQTRELTACLQCRAISEIQRIFSTQKWRPPYNVIVYSITASPHNTQQCSHVPMGALRSKTAQPWAGAAAQQFQKQHRTDPPQAQLCPSVPNSSSNTTSSMLTFCLSYAHASTSFSL